MMKVENVYLLAGLLWLIFLVDLTFSTISLVLRSDQNGIQRILENSSDFNDTMLSQKYMNPRFNQMIHINRANKHWCLRVLHLIITEIFIGKVTQFLTLRKVETPLNVTCKERPTQQWQQAEMWVSLIQKFKAILWPPNTQFPLNKHCKVWHWCGTSNQDCYIRVSKMATYQTEAFVENVVQHVVFMPHPKCSNGCQSTYLVQ